MQLNFPSKIEEIKCKSVFATTTLIKRFVRLRKNYSARVCFVKCGSKSISKSLLFRKPAKEKKPLAVNANWLVKRHSATGFYNPNTKGPY